MEEKSKVIFGNPMPDKVYRKAVKSKKKYAKKFGDDAGADYPAIVKKNEYIGDMLGVHDIRVGETGENVGFDTERGIIVGNIRMDSDITAFPWRSHLRHIPWAMYRTGWT